MNKSESENPPAKPSVPVPLYPYYAYPEEDITLIELWQILWKRRVLILFFTLFCGLMSAVVSLLLPDIYRAEALLSPAAEEDSQNGIASTLGGLGGLASIAGVSLGGGSSVEESLAVLKSRRFIWQFIEQNQLMPQLFAEKWDAKKQRWREQDPEEQPTLWDGFREFTQEGLLSASIGKKNSLVTVAVEWGDPEQAAAWANLLVEQLNAYLRVEAITRSQARLRYLTEELSKNQVADMQQTLYELIAKEQKTAMLANTQKQFAFRILDPAAVPDKKAKPRRALITLTGLMMGFILSVMGVFAYHSFKSNDAESEQAKVG